MKSPVGVLGHGHFLFVPNALHNLRGATSNGKIVPRLFRVRLMLLLALFIGSLDSVSSFYNNFHGGQS
jgi:hypothetical protein